MAISNKYKDFLHDLIDSLDKESLNWPDFPGWLGPIDKGLHNAPRFRDDSLTFPKKDCLDEDVSVTLLKLVPKIQNY